MGAVVIGRNEGERLALCLRSVRRAFDRAVYVDSGSSDGSPELAASLGLPVVELDPGRPFSAARARNAGLARLLEQTPDLEMVQFVDGDCELDPAWPGYAAAFLATRPDVAVACGRRRERRPEASPWNLLADLEWDTPVGEAAACGGDALMRVDAVRRVGGYDESLIAGEDPELCHRLRRAGHRIVRLDREMTRHDADMTRFRQWWRRQTRSGHAYAELALRHRDPHRVRRLLSIGLWAGALPVLCLLLVPATGGASLLGLGLLGVVGLRAYRGRRPRATPRHAALYAAACVLGKFAELQGVLAFAWNRAVRRRASTLIEYKQGG